ncbi:MAG: CotH kinase family protein [Clostridia bacterium]|nr:CotH kinase family protein [Clostridia bacterium]
MKKITSIILTVIIALSCVSLIGYADDAAGLTDFAVSVAFDGEKPEDAAEKKTSWFGADGKYWLFIPTSIGTGEVTVNFEPASADVKVDGVSVANGGVISLEGKDKIKVSCGAAEYDVDIIAESKVASVFIETDSGSLDFIHEKKGNEEEGNISIIGADGEEIEYAGRLEIKGRGNSTWQMEKKPYNIKLDSKKNLFGMGKTKKWSLIANHGDESLIRNALAYQAAENAGMPYTPQFTPVDVYINNDYMGSYLLTTRIGIDGSNVDIEDLEGNTEDVNKNDLDTYPRGGLYGTYAGLLEGTSKWYEIPNDPEDITGGYIIEMELANRYADEASGFVTTRSQPFTMKTPEYASKAQMEYISALYQKFEDAVYSGKSMEELGKLCNVESLAQMYILNEWCSNQDFGLTSTYFYKPEGANETLYAGPAWDFDIAFGNNDSGRFGNDYTDPEKWTVCYNRMYRNTVFGKWDIDEQPNVFNILTKNEDFIKEVERVWNSYFKSAVDETIDWAMNEYTDSIRGSAIANAIRWNIFGTRNVNDIDGRLDNMDVNVIEFADVKADTMSKSIGKVQTDAPETNVVLKALKTIPVAINNAFEKLIVAFDLVNKI